MEQRINEILELLIGFQKVKRKVFFPGSREYESDTEHSYNLAMTALIIIEKDRLPLDEGLCLKYALIHDLVEVYAGDTMALDSKQVATKPKREAMALRKLASKDSTKELAKIIAEYEKLDSEESKFIYSLDKLMPAFNILYNNDLVWKEHGITFLKWEEISRKKIELSKYTKPYLDYILPKLRSMPELFA